MHEQMDRKGVPPVYTTDTPRAPASRTHLIDCGAIRGCRASVRSRPIRHAPGVSRCTPKPAAIGRTATIKRGAQESQSTDDPEPSHMLGRVLDRSGMSAERHYLDLHIGIKRQRLQDLV